ncbi:MAG: RNA polymerase sigma factor [Candidatus Sulfotelmatobacter sp.]|jgi:RNA polymerase sigma-70 factor (ECF subfamily)
MSSPARYFPDLVKKGVRPYPTVGTGAQISSDQVERLKSEQPGSTGGTESPTSGNINYAVESSDEVLMARIGDGDKEGLACLFRRYARLVRAVGYKILRDDSEADDLLQDVFLFIHQKSRVFDSSKSSARSWIVQMAYHRAIDRRRYLDSRHFYTQVDLEDVGNELSGPGTRAGRFENSIEEVLGRIGLRRVFGVLSEIQRQTLGLRLVDGYTFEEIAVKLDQTRGNVKNHYFRALEKLRKQIFSCNRQSD